MSSMSTSSTSTPASSSSSPRSTTEPNTSGPHSPMDPSVKDGNLSDADVQTSKDSTPAPSSSSTPLSSYLWPFGTDSKDESSSSDPACKTTTPPPLRRRPTYEEFRRHEPPQARLIRLRGLFDKLLDKSGESALANGRAKEAWTKSSIRARLGSGLKTQEAGPAAAAKTAKASEAPSFSEQSADRASKSSTGGSPRNAGSAAYSPSTEEKHVLREIPAHQLPQPSYATELLAKCKRSHDPEAHRERKQATKVRKEAEAAAASSSASPPPSSSAPKTGLPSPLFGRDRAADAARDGEAGWEGSGVWGLTAVSLDHLEEALSATEEGSTSDSSSKDSAAPQTASEKARTGGATEEEVARLEEKERAEREAEDGLRQRRIEWEGFLKYAEEKERELYTIFQELDKNGDGILDLTEIRAAMERAGIDMGSAPVQDFTASLASSRYYPTPTVAGLQEGSMYVTFPEFRDYLLLLPRKATMPEIFKFYQVRKAFGLFIEGGVFEELGRGWGKTKRGAAVVNFDGDVSLAGEEKMKGTPPTTSSSTFATGPSGSASAAYVAVQSMPGASDGRKGSQSQPHGAGHSSEGDDHTEDARNSMLHEGAQAGAGDGHHEEVEEEDDDALHPEIALKFLLAGGIAGAVSRTATAPFDRLKVYLITSSKKSALGDAASNGAKAVAEATAKGMKAGGGTGLYAAATGVSAGMGQAAASSGHAASKGAGLLKQAIVNLYREGGGLKAFWTGNGLNVIKIFPESAIKFMSYEMSKRAFAKYVDHVSDSRDISGTSRFLSGGIGGITSQLAIYPVETLKTRLMASQQGDSKGLLLKTMKDMYQSGGVRLYYRGLTAGLIGVFPYSAIDMSAFEGIKLFYIKYTGKEEPGVMALLAFGSISGSVGATTVYPLNLIRTRLQAAGTPAHPQRYEGFWDAVRTTHRNEGVVGFYRGLVPTLAKVVPAVSISYVVYEHSKKKLGVL